MVLVKKCNAFGIKMKFNVSLKDLKKLISFLCDSGEDDWQELSSSRYQFKRQGGGTLNFNSITNDLALSVGNANIKSEQKKDGTIVESKFEKSSISDASTSEYSEEKSASKAQNCEGSELVIALVGALGTNLDQIVSILKEKLPAFNYICEEIKISKDIIEEITGDKNSDDNFTRISSLMDSGNEIRKKAKDCAVLAKAAAAKINSLRKDGQEPCSRHAFIINSLKNPSEVQALREIYSNGIFLIGVYSDFNRRLHYLTKNKRIGESDAEKLMKRDSEESEEFGQHTAKTFHLADFFVSFDGSQDKLQNDLWRIIDLLFGQPYITPTFDEFAMFMAFSASLRSADLSRQVGAVLTKNKNIISTGANDVPKAGGGLYWAEYNDKGIEIIDVDNGRDYKRGYDSNAKEKENIIDEIIQSVSNDQKEEIKACLSNSRIKDITEYGRVVHAEMEAILGSSRTGVSTVDTDLYCTTFPCHNCAKHIIASGIKRVIFVEPYPKSKAFDFHRDSIASANQEGVSFEPFVGVGPRSFFNLFSTKLGSGFPVKRKNYDGKVINWDESIATLRMKMIPSSYIERESIVASELYSYINFLKNEWGLSNETSK
ncbi:anti-phage dCTP deaminase [Zooshikella harenae]|uniref:CMP/dCMP-type deaminase domain-containing protein n=1 Tax=Zooshikella harenae TaxID=2827238 RepID=A0ABS5ZIR2_9GAMM|nr:anti-phage dCTP deaminase [Zooshikella harenae]MBU2713962.1 hypothetical protein [Zooshikella harenae]